MTSSFDGVVRLYGSDLARLAAVKAPGGTRPLGVRFSPDGREVVVGYHYAARVDVLSGADLRPVRRPDTADLTNGDLSKVAWSDDGRTLSAAGMHRAGGQHLIRRWAESGHGAPADLPAGVSETIVDLQPLPGGRLAFAAADPAWAVLGASGRLEAFDGPAIADFRFLGAGFLLDPTGSVVRFGFRMRGAAPATFDARERTLAVEPADDPASSRRGRRPPGSRSPAGSTARPRR